jgi:hypothetical protein
MYFILFVNFILIISKLNLLENEAFILIQLFPFMLFHLKYE